ESTSAAPEVCYDSLGVDLSCYSSRSTTGSPVARQRRSSAETDGSFGCTTVTDLRRTDCRHSCRQTLSKGCRKPDSSPDLRPPRGNGPTSFTASAEQQRRQHQSGPKSIGASGAGGVEVT